MDEPVRKGGVKLKNQETPQTQEKKLKQQYKEKFEENVDKAIESDSEKKKKGILLFSRFFKMCDDKCLNRNKTEIQKSVEKEINAEMVEFALNLNNDPAEENDGLGSIVLSQAVLRVVTSQRDRINDLEYELIELKKDRTRMDQEIQTLKKDRVSNS
jgi:hypothetical protein